VLAQMSEHSLPPIVHPHRKPVKEDPLVKVRFARTGHRSNPKV
jgi:hypothetical protein